METLYCPPLRREKCRRVPKANLNLCSDQELSLSCLTKKPPHPLAFTALNRHRNRNPKAKPCTNLSSLCRVSHSLHLGQVKTKAKEKSSSGFAASGLLASQTFRLSAQTPSLNLHIIYARTSVACSLARTHTHPYCHFRPHLGRGGATYLHCPGIS